jgi:hypothetical protein
MGFTICPACPAIFASKEADVTLARLAAHIYGLIFFAASEAAREKPQKMYPQP